MNGVHFRVHQDQNFYKLDYRFLINVARHKRKRKVVKFLQYITKKHRSDAKHSDTLRGSSQVCFYLFLGGCSQKWE